MDVKKIAIFGIIFVLVFSVSAPANTMHFHGKMSNYADEISNGKTLYVGGSGPNNYSSIQEAINDASNGDTIFVYNGTYYENIVINKSINLVGEDAKTTIIDGRKKGDTIIIHGNKINFNGFTIRNSSKWPSSGIFVSGSYFINISNNIITSNGNGISLYSTHNSVISNNTVTRNEAGIDFGAYCSDNIAFHNYISNNGGGFKIESNENKISSNILYKNDVGMGIEGSNNIIYNNLILSSEIIGIAVWEGSKNMIMGNNISKNHIGIQIGIFTFKHTSPCMMNKIIKNNFIENLQDTYVVYHNFPVPNIWFHNYWDKWELPLPKPIMGILVLNIILFLPWLNFDWLPSLRPIEWWEK